VDEFNTGMQGELRDRRFQSQRLGEADEVSALSNLLASYQKDQATSPLRQQGLEIDAIENADREAIQQGFMGQPMGSRTLSPGQERNVYQRGQSEFQQGLPLQREMIRAEGLTDAARIRAGSASDVEKLRAERERGNMKQFQSFLGGMQGQEGSGRQVRSAGMPGGFRATFEDEDEGLAGIPSSTLVNLANYSRSAAAANDRDRPALEQGLRVLQLNALERANVSSPELKDWVSSILSEPSYSQLDFDSILQEHFQLNPEDMDYFLPEEQEEARQLITALRGR
jgi:hypothetical protein